MKLTIKEDGCYWRLKWEDYTPPKDKKHTSINGMPVEYDRAGFTGIAVSNLSNKIVVGYESGNPIEEVATMKEYRGRRISREDIKSIIKTLYK